MRKTITALATAALVAAGATPASATHTGGVSTNITYSTNSSDAYPYLAVWHPNEGYSERIPQGWTAYHATKWYLASGRCAVVSAFKDGAYLGQWQVGYPGWQSVETDETHSVRVFTC